MRVRAMSSRLLRAPRLALGSLAARCAARLIGPQAVVARLGLAASVDPVAPYFWDCVDGRLVPHELALAGRELIAPGAGQVVNPIGAVRGLAQRPRACACSSESDGDFALFELRLAFDSRGSLARIERKDIAGDGPSCELRLRDEERRLVEQLERASPARAPLAHSRFRYDASGRPVAQTGLRHGLRFEVQLAYDGWEGRATESVRIEGRELGRRVHELDERGRVLATRQINEQGYARRIASYEYAADDGEQRCYRHDEGARSLRMRVRRSADGSSETVERFEADGRCSSSRHTLRGPDGIECVRTRRESIRTESGRLRERSLETRAHLRGADGRVLHGATRCTDLETGEVEHELERYAYEDDAEGNWTQRERCVQLPGGDWRALEVHTRRIQYAG